MNNINRQTRLGGSGPIPTRHRVLEVTGATSKFGIRIKPETRVERKNKHHNTRVESSGNRVLTELTNSIINSTSRLKELSK